jgi:NAD(P)-dependent dehydrogenase (short-subunit alcohol dehydrogenase family)/acyl dehydratase/putative sterol carrier protein
MSILKNKVALITGAGGGLGRAYALLFASQGAKVVVNDLGGARDGSGGGNAMADKVVAEIKEAGGQAIANYGSVAVREDAEAMVAQAVDAFGSLDIVVNNAGILRDKTLAKMTDDMWDLVNEVHLKGTYLVTQAAVEAMTRAGNGGRIINTSSYAGLKGNFGQANYGAAKAGIAGFTRVAALETRKAGITVNAIAPVAKTRMTEDINMVPEEYEPEDIAPLVCWLASDDAADVTGRVFGAHGSHYFEYNVEMTDGVDLGGERWSPADVGKRFDEITRKAPKAAPESGGAGDAVRALFEAIPATFKADKAGDWTATILFDIGGQATYSLVVEDGAASFVDGAADNPKGKVTFASGDIVLDMAQGKLAPEQAFMQGKISTDNMGVLMKFGKFFDLQAAAGATGGGNSPLDQAKTLFAAVPETYKADKAGDWKATLVFDIGGEATLSLVAADGSCSFVDGAADNPTAKVKLDSAQTILDMATGKVQAEQAFMQGKISTDNMGALMKFGQYFDLAAAAKALGGGQVGGGGGAPELNLDAVGKKYRGAATFAEPEHMVMYAEATDAESDRYNPDGDKPIAHPIFPVRLLHDALGQMIVDPELNADILRLVHGEQDMRFHRHLRPWDLAAPRAEIAEIVEKSSGYLVNVRTWLMVDGEQTTEVVSGLFIRKPKKEDGAEKPKKKADEPADMAEREVLFESTQVVADDQPRRYAAASLDDNPIHLDEEVAKSAGHPSVILHGLCTMAFAANAMVDGPCEGDPDRLARLKVRFSKPVLPGWELTTRIWKEAEGAGVTTFGLEVVNQDGVPVITNAVAEVR